MKFLQHLSAILIITIIMGLIYASVQKTYRSNANDPQTQIIHDLKDRLQEGKPVGELFSDTVDLEKSLAVFIETYDEEGKPLQSSGYLNGQLPKLPNGVFDQVKAKGEDWVTWQPRPDVRMAMGILGVNTSAVSYVAVGRSLKEVEERVSRLVKMIIISWALCVLVILFNLFVQFNSYKTKIQKELL